MGELCQFHQLATVECFFFFFPAVFLLNLRQIGIICATLAVSKDRRWGREICSTAALTSLPFFPFPHSLHPPLLFTQLPKHQVLEGFFLFLFPHSRRFPRNSFASTSFACFQKKGEIALQRCDVVLCNFCLRKKKQFGFK